MNIRSSRREKMKKIEKNIDRDIMDVSSRIVRRGNKSGNVPWRKKFYSLDRKKYEESVKDKSIGILPPQGQSTLMWMYDRMKEGEMGTGSMIQSRSIEEGYVRSKIDPPVLFAYYRKKMEEFGLIHVEYDPTMILGITDEEEE